MHFRIRKNVIQLIRTTYDVDKKKGVNTTVGAVPLSAPELKADLRSQMSGDEILAFESWVATQHRTNLLREELAAMTLAESLALADKWFEKHGDSQPANAIVRDILLNWHSLRKTLAKKGLLD